MLGAVDHLIIFVEDLARAKAFYQGTLGLRLVLDSPQFVGFLAGGQMIGLHPSETDGSDVGVGPIPYFRVDDLDGTLRQLQERGVHLHREPVKMPSGQIIATIHDSEGNALGLCQNPTS